MPGGLAGLDFKFWNLSEPGASLGTEKGHGGFVYAPNSCKLLFMPQRQWRASGVTPERSLLLQDPHKSSCFAQGREENEQKNPFIHKIPAQMCWWGWHWISLNPFSGVLKKTDLEVTHFGAIFCNFCSFLIFNFLFRPEHCSFPGCCKRKKHP